MYTVRHNDSRYCEISSTWDILETYGSSQIFPWWIPHIIHHSWLRACSRSLSLEDIVFLSDIHATRWLYNHTSSSGVHAFAFQSHRISFLLARWEVLAIDESGVSIIRISSGIVLILRKFKIKKLLQLWLKERCIYSRFFLNYTDLSFSESWKKK